MTDDMARTLRRAAVLIGLVWLPIVLFWGAAPFTLTFDDAYYYFEIGRNVADGLGTTFDGADVTNGYHPLWLGITSLAFLAGLDGLDAVRVLIVLQLAGWVITLSLVGHHVGSAIARHDRADEHGDAPIVRRARDSAVLAAFVLVGANPFVLKMFVNGLESGVTALLYTVLLVRIVAVGGRLTATTDTRWRLTTGLVLGLAFLGRTDAVLLIAVLGAWALVDSVSAGRFRLRPVVEVFAPTAVIAAAYVLANTAIFGEPTQVSGDIKRQALTAGRAALMLAAGVVALAIAVAARRPAPAPRLPRTRAFVAATAWFASFNVLLVAYYVVLSIFPYLWYFAPTILYGAWLVLLFLADAVEGAALEASERPVGRAVGAVAAIVLVPVVAAMAFQTARFVDPNVRSIQQANRDAGRWISDNLPEDAVLGSFDAGVIGYFTEQRIINLDGVVNTFEWQAALEDGTTDDFLRTRGLDHLVNHGIVVDGDDPDMRDRADSLLGAGTGDALDLLRTWEFTFSGRIDGEGVGDSAKEMAVFLYAVPGRHEVGAAP